MAADTGHEIIAMRKQCEDMKPYERRDCPVCGWTIEKTKEGDLHCKFCGWVSG